MIGGKYCMQNLPLHYDYVHHVMIGKLRTLLEEAVELEIELQCLFLKTLAREPFHSLLLTLN